MIVILSCLDADECNASVPVCDVNAKCINTIGSFICACKIGFSGDGFSCSGKKTLFPYVLDNDLHNNWESQLSFLFWLITVCLPFQIKNIFFETSKTFSCGKNCIRPQSKTEVKRNRGILHNYTLRFHGPRVNCPFGA